MSTVTPITPPQEPKHGAAFERQIGDHTYGTRFMPPEMVLKHAAKIAGLGMNASAIASSSDAGIMSVLEDCFDLAMVDGRELGRRPGQTGGFWRTHFLGKPRDLVRVVAFMLEVHFADFFDEAMSVGGELSKRFGASLVSKGSASQ